MKVLARRLSGVDMAILQHVETGPCSGLGTLMEAVNTHDWHWARMRLEKLRQDGLIDLDLPSCAGRGHKIIIRRSCDR